MKQRSLKKTILIVGEGETEDAVLTHLKNLYWDRKNSNHTIKVKSASGGSPASIAEYTLAQNNLSPHDMVYIFLDSDKVLCTKFTKIVNKNRFKYFQSVVCLDCELVRILGSNKTEIHGQCKSMLKSIINCLPTDIESVQRHFPIYLFEKYDQEPFKSIIEIMKTGKISRSKGT